MSLDIFSRKKQIGEKKKGEIVIVDNRERNSLVPSELIKLGCLIKFEQLSIGDYVSNGYVIERKTFSDLQSSIINRRMFSQLDSLKSQEKAILIIEGERSDWSLNDNAFRGFVLSCIKNKIPFIISSKPEDTAKYIFLISQNKKPSSFSLRPYKKNESKEDILIYILEGFPGIGPITAKKLVEKFKNLKNIINAPEEELREILGKKYELFKNLIN